MSYSLELDFGSGWEDKSASLYGQFPFKRSRSVHNRLRPVVGTCSFALVRDPDLVKRFLTASGDIGVRVLKNGTPWFRGMVRPTDKLTVSETSVEPFTIEAVDAWYRLEKQVGFTETWTHYTISNPTTPAASILHQLFIRAGFLTAELSFPTIPISVDVAVFERGKKTYRQIIEKILEETGYSARVDESGVVELYDLGPASIVPSVTLSTGADGNVASEYTTARREASAEAVDVTVTAHRAIADAVVFEDSTGGGSGKACSIPIAAGGYYPEGASASVAPLAQFRVADEELVAVDTPTLDLAFSGSVTQQVWAQEGNAARLRLYSASGGEITRLRATGSAVVKGDVSKSIRELVVNTEKRETIDCEWVTEKTDADRLATLRGLWHQHARREWAMSTTVMSLRPGDYVQFSDLALLGVSQLLRVVTVNDGFDDLAMSITAEGAAPFAVEEILVDAATTKPPAPSAGIEVALLNRPTTEEVATMIVEGVAPTNNVSNVTFAFSQNADASIHIRAAWDYTQGANPANGAYVYRKSNESAPGAFDYASDPAQWIRMEGDGSFSWEYDVPAKMVGINLELHYRFGVVAGMGSKLHIDGAVTPAGWDDITFVPAIGDIDLVLEDKALRAYTGQGVQLRAVQIGHESVDWVDCPDTDPASPEQLRARIGRLGVGPAVLMDGEFMAPMTDATANSIPVVTSGAELVAIARRAEKTFVFYTKTADKRVFYKVDSGAGFSAESLYVNETLLGGYPNLTAAIESSTGRLYVAYQKNSDNNVWARYYDGSVWSGEELVANDASQSHVSLANVGGLIACAYGSTTNYMHISRKVGSAWSLYEATTVSRYLSNRLLGDDYGELLFAVCYTKVGIAKKVGSAWTVEYYGATLAGTGLVGAGSYDVKGRVIIDYYIPLTSPYENAVATIDQAAGTIAVKHITDGAFAASLSLVSSGNLLFAYVTSTGAILLSAKQNYARIGAGIIERGDGYIWFSDGTVIEWGIASATLAINIAFMGGYRSSGIAVTLPMPLDAEPDFTSVTPTGLTAFGAHALPATGAETTAINILWTAVSSQASDARTAKWFVFGRKAA